MLQARIVSLKWPQIMQCLIIMLLPHPYLLHQQISSSSSSLGISNVCIPTQRINWLTGGNRDIWVQFDTNSKCHATLLCLSPLFFESPPPGFAICIQLFATGYEYSEPFFWAQSKANLITASGRRGRRTSSCRRARCLTHMFHPGMNDWQVLALWHAGLFRVPYLWWKNSPRCPPPPPPPHFILRLLPT